MTRPMMEDAFAHHAWATLRLLDACAQLSREQLSTAVPGTYGSILDTLRHLVEADASYLYVTGGQLTRRVDASGMDLQQLRRVMEDHAAAWPRVLEGDPDPDRMLVRRRDDGSATHAPLGIRLAQALHHGTDHRSQVCTALTTLGVTPPEIDAWDFARAHDRTIEEPPTS